MSSAPQPRSSRSPCRTAYVFLAAALLTGAGCGLSDYEKKMEEDLVRAQKFDDDNANLADAADLPADGVFWRPPRGVARAPQEALVEKVLSAFSPTARNPEFQMVYFAASTDEKEEMKAFEEKVWSALKEAPKPTTPDDRVGTRSGHRPMKFDKASYSTKDTAVYVYFYQDPKDPDYKIALVFSVDYTQGETDVKRLKTAGNLIDYSLSSLAVGKAAEKRKKQFRPRPPEEKK